jgi:hypothetical protein
MNAAARESVIRLSNELASKELAEWRQHVVPVLFGITGSHNEVCDGGVCSENLVPAFEFAGTRVEVRCQSGIVGKGGK